MDDRTRASPVSRRQIPGLVRLTINLRACDVKAARAEGKHRCLPYQAVLREWVAEHALAAEKERSR